MVAATDHGGKFLNIFTPVINSAWIIDSGATNHMTFVLDRFHPLDLPHKKLFPQPMVTQPQSLGKDP